MFLVFFFIHLILKLTNRQMKLKVLKDEAVTKIEKINTPKEKKMKCGQCEKGLAFTVIEIFILVYWQLLKIYAKLTGHTFVKALGANKERKFS